MFKGKTRQMGKRGQIHVGKPFFMDSEPLSIASHPWSVRIDIWGEPFYIHMKHKPTKRAIRRLPKTAIELFVDVHGDPADLA